MLTFKPMISILASAAMVFSLGCSGGSGGTNAGGSSGGGGGTVPIKKVFVLDHDTSGDLKSEGGGSNGPDGGDRLCQADSQSSGGVYKAMVVDGVHRVACSTADCSGGGAGEHVDWVFASNTKYVHADDGMTEIGVTNGKGLFDFPLTNEWAVSGVDLWTGLNGDWTTATHTCSGYTSSGAVYSAIGHPSAKDASAISASTYSCSYYSTTVLCVEQ